MFCVSCGEKQPEVAKFCHACGSKLFTKESNATTSGSDQRNELVSTGVERASILTNQKSSEVHHVSIAVIAIVIVLTCFVALLIGTVTVGSKEEVSNTPSLDAIFKQERRSQSQTPDLDAYIEHANGNGETTATGRSESSTPNLDAYLAQNGDTTTKLPKCRPSLNNPNPTKSAYYDKDGNLLDAPAAEEDPPCEP